MQVYVYVYVYVRDRRRIVGLMFDKQLMTCIGACIQCNIISLTAVQPGEGRYHSISLTRTTALLHPPIQPIINTTTTTTHPSRPSRSKTPTQSPNNPISRRCTLRPAGVSACLPAPHPNGKTSLRRPYRSITTSASSGKVPPPSGCMRPRRTKWLQVGVAAWRRGREKGARGEMRWVEGSWQRRRGWRVGERV